jgi:hypothetical protein
MDTNSRSPQLLDRYLAASERGNLTSVEIAAPPATAWEALGQTTLSECRLTGALVTLRGLPSRLLQRGAFYPGTSDSSRSVDSGSRDDDRTEAPLLGDASSGRFLVLDQAPGQELVRGLVGQFWKLTGGTDVALADSSAFVEFNEPGYVKTAINFRVERTATGSRLTTETRSVTTDASSRRKFALYWLAIGWASKLIRRDMLAAVRRRAERPAAPQA